MPVDQSETPHAILTALTAKDFALLQLHLERIELTKRQTLIKAGMPVEHVHFLKAASDRSY